MAAAAAAALTAGVLAAPVDAAVGPTRVVTISPADGVVIVEGLSHSDTYAVTVERGGVVIGSAGGSPATFGTFGALELNHPTELFDPFCWQGVTPRMQKGDVVRVTGPGVDDTATVQDIAMLTYPEPTAGPGGVPAFEVTGTLGAGLDPTNVDVFIRLDLNPQPPGGDDDNPEPVVDDTDDWRASSSDEGNTFEVGAGGKWTATFTTGFMLEDVVTPVNEAVLAAAPAPRVLQAGYSAGTPPAGENRGGNETTLALPPGAGEPVPLGCPSTADSAIGHVSPSVINTTNQTSGLQVSGISTGSAVDVTVSGPGGVPRTETVSVLPNGTWSASFTGPLAGFEGELAVTASHDGVPSAAPANRRMVLRDTQAPVAPVSIPGNGSFTHSMQVLLASAETEIRYTEGDGTQAPPTATTGRRYTGSILLASTTTLKAVAVDAARNVSPVMTRTFTKLAPTLPPTTPRVPPPPDGAASLVPLSPAMGKVEAGRPGGKKTATVRWRASLANGVVVERYQVRALKLSAGHPAKVRKTATVAGDVTKKRLVLPDGRYRFEVRALGAAGASPWSERSAKVRPR